MASYSVATAAHKTLTGATVDTVTLTGAWSRVEVLNRAAAGGADIYFTQDGTTPTVGCDDCFVVPAASALNIPATDVSGNEVVLVIGSGNAYSVVGMNERS